MCDYLIIRFSNYFGNHFRRHGITGAQFFTIFEILDSNVASGLKKVTNKEIALSREGQSHEWFMSI